MAKKKTVENIKAAPVLRAQGGDPTPVTPIITKSYCVRDDWKDKDKVNYVAFKSVDGEITDVKVNGEPAGGGGGSEISLVTLTISDPQQEGVSIVGLWSNSGASSFNGTAYTDDFNGLYPVLYGGSGVYVYGNGHLPEAYSDTISFKPIGSPAISYYMIITGEGSLTI